MVSPDPGPNYIFHILVTFDTEAIDWVYVGSLDSVMKVMVDLITYIIMAVYTS